MWKTCMKREYWNYCVSNQSFDVIWENLKTYVVVLMVRRTTRKRLLIFRSRIVRLTQRVAGLKTPPFELVALLRNRKEILVSLTTKVLYDQLRILTSNFHWIFLKKWRMINLTRKYEQVNYFCNFPIQEKKGNFDSDLGVGWVQLPYQNCGINYYTNLLVW